MKKKNVLWFLSTAALLVLLYGNEIDFKQIVKFVKQESAYMIHCKALLPKVLKTPATLDVINEFETANARQPQKPDTHKVALTYDAQNLYGAVVRNEFVCVYEAGATIGPKDQPKLLSITFEGAPLPDEEINWFNRASELGFVLGD